MRKLAALLFLIAPALFAQSVNGIANQTVVGNSAFITGAGAANVMTGCPSPAISSQSAGLIIHVRPNTANTTTTPTFNLCTLGATTVVKASGGSLIALAAGDYATGVDATFYYTGSFWQLMNPQTGAGGIPYPGAGIPNSTGTAWGTSFAVQGTDTKVMTAGTVSGVASALCTDVNLGATTVGCPSSGGGFPFTVAQEGQFNSGSSNVSSYTVTFPHALAASGNTAFLLIAADGSNAVTIPAGWTSDFNQPQSTFARIILCHKTTAGDTSATMTVATSPSSFAVYFFELAGSHALDQSATGGMANTNTIQTPNITPTANSLVFSAACIVTTTGTGPVVPNGVVMGPWNNFGFVGTVGGARGLVGFVSRQAATNISTMPPAILIPSALFTAGGGIAYATFSIL